MYMQAVGGLAVSHLPAVLGLQTRDRRIHHQQLVHQLTGALHENRVTLAAPAFRPGRRRSRAADRRASSAPDVAAMRVSLIVTSGRRKLLPHRGRHRLGQHEILLARLEVTPQRLELARGGTGRTR